MAKERIVNVRFWRDNYIVSLKPDARLLFLWAITNPATELCGAYETPLVTIEAETGLKGRRIREVFDQFYADGKMLYKDGWVIIKNFAKHQHGTSTKIKEGIKRTLNDCPDWVKDTVSNGIEKKDTVSHLDLDSVRQPRPELGKNGGGPPAPEATIWEASKALLITRSRMSQDSSGAFLGKMAKDYGKTKLAEALGAMLSNNPAEPKSYLVAVLQGRKDKARPRAGESFATVCDDCGGFCKNDQDCAERQAANAKVQSSDHHKERQAI